MVLKWWGYIDEITFKRYEVRHLKCSKHSIFYSYIVWVGRTLVWGICGLETVLFKTLLNQLMPL